VGLTWLARRHAGWDVDAGRTRRVSRALRQQRRGVKGRRPINARPVSEGSSPPQLLKLRRDVHWTFSHLIQPRRAEVCLELVGRDARQAGWAARAAPVGPPPPLARRDRARATVMQTPVAALGNTDRRGHARAAAAGAARTRRRVVVDGRAARLASSQSPGFC